MFEAAELGREVSKDDFERLAPALRIELLELQQKLRNCDFPVILVFAGVNGAGKGETVNLINEWMDPRWMVTRAYGDASDEERERPEYWRYWRDLPQNGKIGMFLSSWYSRPVLDAAFDRITDAELDERLERIKAFEKCLADDGALILKFWMHLSQKAQKKRLKSLEKDPHESWRVTATDWEHWRMYDRFAATGERAIMQTSKGYAPWSIVEGADPRYRSLTVLTTFRDSVLRHLEARAMQKSVASNLQVRNTLLPPGEPTVATELAEAPRVVMPILPSILHALDMTRSMEKKAQAHALQEGRARLNGLYRRAKAKGISTVLVFEGWDAAGKGGVIRRLVGAMDARDYMVIPVAAPTDEERAHHYLWRFWRHLSRAGRVTLFDRSWYGRVLVERVEGFASQEEWMRAYAEINEFEQQLVQGGIVLAKFWMHITKDEQERRFKDRSEIAYKRWKLTDEDWRNREKWDSYEVAVNDMSPYPTNAGATTGRRTRLFRAAPTSMAPATIWS